MTRTKFRLALAIFPALLLIVAAATACGGDDDATKTAAPADTVVATTANPSAAASGVEIDQDNLAFSPGKVTVKSGETVTFKNAESALHTVDINGKNESGNMKKGAIFQWTAGAPGTYKITCDYHPQMNATITVQ